MEDVRPEIDLELCDRCGACVEACEFEVLKMRGSGPAARGIGRCLACGHCVAVCPAGAVSHPAMPADRLRDLPDAPAVGFDALMALLGQRRSVRRYQERPVGERDLRDLVEAAILAPSGHNSQPWQFTFMTDRSRLDAVRAATIGFYAELLATLSDEARRPEQGEGVAGRHDPMVPAIQLMVRAHQRGGSPPVGRSQPGPHALPPRRPRGRPELRLRCGEYAAGRRRERLGACLIGFLSIPVMMGHQPVIEALGLPEGHAMHVAMVLGHPALTYHRSVARREPPVTFV